MAIDLSEERRPPALERCKRVEMPFGGTRGCGTRRVAQE
jgi:hypothetical protein